MSLFINTNMAAIGAAYKSPETKREYWIYESKKSNL